MDSDPVILEYARGVSAPSDQYRLLFLLAAIPGGVICFLLLILTDLPSGVPSANLLTAVCHLRMSKSLAEAASTVAFALAALTPCSAIAWRLLRLRNREHGEAAKVVGMALAVIHLAGVIGVAIGILANGPWSLNRGIPLWVPDVLFLDIPPAVVGRAAFLGILIVGLGVSFLCCRYATLSVCILLLLLVASVSFQMLFVWFYFGIRYRVLHLCMPLAFLECGYIVRKHWSDSVRKAGSASKALAMGAAEQLREDRDRSPGDGQRG